MSRYLALMRATWLLHTMTDGNMVGAHVREESNSEVKDPMMQVSATFNTNLFS